MKVQRPLQSLEASGTIGPRITFSKRKSGQQVRYQRAQKIIVPTWGQADQQSLYRVIYARWLSFSAAEKKVYDDEVKAKNLSMSGWNLFLKYAMANPKTRLGLCGYWSMNRTGFGTILDLSKNGNVGTLKPSWPSDSPQYVPSKNKKLLNALSFDGAGDYVNTNYLLNAPNFTVSLWVYSKVGVAGTGYLLITKMGWSTQASWEIQQYGSASLYFKIYPTYGSANYFYTYYGSFAQNRWFHIVGTYNGIESNLYIDGILKDTEINSSGVASSNIPITIGSTSIPLGFFNGSIDEVMIFNRALSLPEIQALYNQFK